MLLEDCGELNVSRKIIQKVLSFWSSLVTPGCEKVSAKVGKLMMATDNKWAANVRAWLEKLNMSHYWDSKVVTNRITFKREEKKHSSQSRETYI